MGKGCNLLPVDVLFVCVCVWGGDLNGRIDTSEDTVVALDNVLKRVALDTVTNQHGMSLIECLHELMMCVVNGRITPNHDDLL